MGTQESKTVDHELHEEARQICSVYSEGARSNPASAEQFESALKECMKRRTTPACQQAYENRQKQANLTDEQIHAELSRQAHSFACAEQKLAVEECLRANVSNPECSSLSRQFEQCISEFTSSQNIQEYRNGLQRGTNQLFVRRERNYESGLATRIHFSFGGPMNRSN